VFPTKVGGMDVTGNTFGFKRMIAPFILETAGGYSIRHAVTGAALTVDQTGQWFVTDGDGSQLALTPDVVMLMSPGGAAGMQVNVADSTMILKGDTASLALDDALGSKWQSSGILSFSTCGNPGLNHVTTLEGVTQLLTGLFTALATMLVGQGPLPLTGATLGALFAPGAFTLLMNEALLLAGTPACSFAPYLGAIQTALLIPKVPAVNAGVCSVGLLSD